MRAIERGSEVFARRKSPDGAVLLSAMRFYYWNRYQQNADAHLKLSGWMFRGRSDASTIRSAVAEWHND